MAITDFIKQATNQSEFLNTQKLNLQNIIDPNLQNKLGLSSPLEGLVGGKPIEPTDTEEFNLIQKANLEALISEGKTELTDTVDMINRHSGYGQYSSSLYTIINGMNIATGRPITPMSVDHQGYTFFTRPQLNLTYDNVIALRRMSAYADQRPDNMANAIRCMLQPDGFVNITSPDQQVFKGNGKMYKDDLMDVRSNIVDDSNCFIPLLSNSLISFSGLPDLSLNTHTTKEGITKEQTSWIDDRAHQRQVFNITINFENTEGNMLVHFFHCWLEYMGRVAEGTMLPFPINVMTNRIDYNTRIYRIITDRTRRYVQGIASTIAFPTSYPIGRNFDFNRDQRLNIDSKEVSVPFQCVGVEYDDPILIKEFNGLVSRFNPKMKTDMKYSVGNKNIPKHRKNMPIPDPKLMVEITDDQKLLFNYKAYPLISDSNEILWYVEKPIYDKFTKF